MPRYISQSGLFSASYFERVSRDAAVPRERRPPEDVDARIARLVAIWSDVRPHVVRAARPGRAWVGLPPDLEPLPNAQERKAEDDLVKRVLIEVLGYAVESQRALALSDDALGVTIVPDQLAFPSVAAWRAANEAAGSSKRAPSARDYARGACLVVDAKRLSKGVGADEQDEASPPPSKSARRLVSGDAGAAADIEQVAGYLSACGKRWGVLTNGRSWRLMRAGSRDAYLRFDLALYAEDLFRRAKNRDGDVVGVLTDEDRHVFTLFFWLFGLHGTDGGWLDEIGRESDAEARSVRDVLRAQAHEAVVIIARGFLEMPANRLKAQKARSSLLPYGPEEPSQTQLDMLREVALVFLYRLLFALKAEASNLLPLADENGASTLYRKYASTQSIFDAAARIEPSDRARTTAAFRMVEDLFHTIDAGNAYEIPPYDGGLFDASEHPELEWLALHDAAVHALLRALIYLNGDAARPVPYADLDVRDLGDIYEGLLEQRLAFEELGGERRLSLRSERSERKGSGSYFTPDALVEHLVRATLDPLLYAAGSDCAKVLALRVVDPAMGSGHFLVKAVDHIAWYLTLYCDPSDLAAPSDNGPRELAYWRRRVVESCIYGVDVNPMAVELAKVALWLHTAERGKPLSFLDHHLRCGNALVGARLAQLASPALRSKKTKQASVWEARNKNNGKTGRGEGQLELPFPVDAGLFGAVVESVRELVAQPSDDPRDVKAKGKAFADQVERRLSAHRLCADLWCAQWFEEVTDETVAAYDDPAGVYAKAKAVCAIADDRVRGAELERLMEHALVKRTLAGRSEGYGVRLRRFFHWELEFPEVAFDKEGRLGETLGFDAVLGNPPWDKIKPAKRDFYGPFSAEVASTQGPSLAALITKLEAARPSLGAAWSAYEQRMLRYASFLAGSGAFEHQVALVDGRRTGGDPDLFRYFTERATQLLRAGGSGGLVTPSTLWQAEGCTALRRLFFERATLRSLYAFENYRRWAFDIHASFKFAAFTWRDAPPSPEHRFRAAFMLRSARVCEGLAQERVLELSQGDVLAMSPSSLALLDLRNDVEAKLAARLHQALPALASEASGWSVKYGNDLHMTNDAWLFKKREWMKRHGFARVVPERGADGSWRQVVEKLSVAGIPDELPLGGETWVAASAPFYRERGYVERTGLIGGQERTWFAPPKTKAKDEEANRILPGERYTALYEGRMVHNFDHTQKGYVSGEGRRALWEDVPVADKRLAPRVFVSAAEVGVRTRARVGFCDVTGATNERTTLAALLPAGHLAGNTVPTLTTPEAAGHTAELAGLMSAFTSDYLLRLRVSTHLNWTYVAPLVVPARSSIDARTRARIAELVLRLSCTTPELADLWNETFPKRPWTYASAERDLVKRAALRAELDAIVADLYGLSVAEYAYVLSTFPLLDRDQPALPGDRFVTEGGPSSQTGDKGVTWDELLDGSIVELQPRSFVTRDLALHTYARRKLGHTLVDLEAFYRDEVGLDPKGPLSRFRVGEIKDLGERVARAREMGAVGYVPSGRGSSADAVEEEDGPGE